MRSTGVALCAATALMTSACSSGGPSAEDSTSRPGGSSSTTSSTASGSPSSKSSPVATTDAPANSLDLPLRRSFTTAFSSITPLEVKMASSPYSQLPSDQQWWAVKAKSCVKKLEEGQDGVSFSWSPWSITGKDGGTYPASDSTWSDFPRPEYPFGGDRSYLVGQCVQGWIMFALDASTKPATIDYGNPAGEVASWRVG